MTKTPAPLRGGFVLRILVSHQKLNNMASVKYGGIVTGLKGKVGGQVFQGGNGVQVMRNKGNSLGRSSGTRNAATANLVTITTAWRNISDAERRSWYAANTTWPFTDKFGNVYYGNGYQMFVAYNRALLALNVATVNTPAAPSAPGDYGTITAAFDGSVFTVAWSSTMATGQKLFIFASPALSPGVNDNNKRLTFMPSVPTDLGNSVFISDAWVKAYGAGATGARVIVQTFTRWDTFPYMYFKKTQSIIIT